MLQFYVDEELTLPATLELPALPPARRGWNLSLQQLVGAAERLRERQQAGADDRTDWLALVEYTRDRLLLGNFTALPLTGFVQVKNRKERLLAVTHPADRLIEEALLPLLTDRLEATAYEAVHAFRKGRGVHTAALAASRALGRHTTPHVAQVDIADFFPSVDLGLLGDDLRAWAPPRLVELVLALLAAPIHLKNQVIHPGGLPMGCPLSPVLSNLFLQPVDAALAAQPVDYLRYADDLLLIAPSPEARADAGAALTSALEARRLRLKPEKTRLFPHIGPFTWLGHLIDRDGIYDKVSERRLERIEARRADMIAPGKTAPSPAAPESPIAQPPVSPNDDAPEPVNERHRTLYIAGQAIYVAVRDGFIECKRGAEVLRRVPLHRVDRVVYMGTGSFSSGFFASCIDRHIPIAYFSGRGKGYAVIVPEGNLNPLRLRAQFDLRADPERRLQVARGILQAKCDAMLHRIGRADDVAAHADRLRAARERMDRATSIPSLVGHEGAASAEYYAVFRTRVREPDFAFVRRSKRPPRDAVNSLLSFTYALLFSELESALLFHGLDPHPGFLHELHRNHAALASDLLEPYRSLVADSFVLRLVNHRMVRIEGFERQQGGGVYMTPDTRRAVLQAYETFMHTPLGGRATAGTPRRLLFGAVQAMLALVLGETETLRLPLTFTDCPSGEPYFEVAGEAGHAIPESLVCRGEDASGRDEEVKP